MPQSGTVTLLCTDLVNSTAHLQQAGDQTGQHLFRAHHKHLSDAITLNGGEELQWLGDGVLAAFSSTADAVRCAISVQQTSRRGSHAGAFGIRIGLHLGEVLRRDSGYFGTPVTTARQLCDRAQAGQILCSKLVAEILASRHTFEFRSVGDIQLKGLAVPIGVCEAIYGRRTAAVLLSRAPFVGREPQVKRLLAKLDEARNGRGSVAMVRGEAGIGKTRVLEEFAELAAEHGAQVMRGACYDGEWQPPYGPFAEAISDFGRKVDEPTLLAALGKRTSILARIVPGLSELVSNTQEPVLALSKDEERFRLFDAVAQFLIAAARRAPLVLILDDLHWADRGDISMLTHVAHFVTANSILLIGAYRDAEVDRRHPLTQALASISRARDFDAQTIKGLSNKDLADLLEQVGDQNAPAAFIKALEEATDGNPLFIRELLLHLVEEGKILDEGGGWVSKLSIAELGIPEGVRQVIDSRLKRLSATANQLLRVAAAFNGAFSIDVVAAVVGIDENAALGAIDEALEAQLLRPAGNPDSFDFTHAMIRHTLYAELNSARRVRLHRKIAEEMEHAWGERAAHHAAEVAYQFWRGATANGTERGATYAIAAADNAEAAYAHDDACAFLRIALELIAKNDPKRARLLARLAFELTWAMDGPAAIAAATEAGELIAASEKVDAAAEFYEEIARTMFNAGITRGAWELAKQGLRYVNDRRDITWASLTEIDINRAEAEDPDNPGTLVDSPENRELRDVMRQLPREQLEARHIDPIYLSRQEILNSPALSARPAWRGGDLRLSLSLWQQEAADCERRGAIVRALRAWSGVSRCHTALGEFIEARAAIDRAVAMSARIGRHSFGSISLMGARSEYQMALNEDWEQAFATVRQDLGQADSSVGIVEILKFIGPEAKWSLAGTTAGVACAFAFMNQRERALQYLNEISDAIERGAVWGINYVLMTLLAATTIWVLNSTHHIAVIERNLRSKILAPDFRWPSSDARLELAHVSALQGRFEQATTWFAKARATLDQQGARPLRAIADYDEALMYLRRGGNGDIKRAEPYLNAALERFRALGMNGWIRRAESALSPDSATSPT